MKKILAHLLYTSIIIGVYFIATPGSFAQTNKAARYTAEEKRSIEIMKKDGATDASIEQRLMKQKLSYPKVDNTTPVNQSGQLPGINASCGDMGGENVLRHPNHLRHKLLLASFSS